jgi:hypothetical protein
VKSPKKVISFIEKIADTIRLQNIHSLFAPAENPGNVALAK